MANYLVTGVAGFVASRVAGLLLADGHHVVGIDTLNDAYDVRLKRWRLNQIQEESGFQFHQLDISDRPALMALMDRQAHDGNPGFDAIINLAARAGVRQSVENPWVYFETNVTGTLNLLDTCQRYGIRKFILASTSSLYGGDNPLPYREDADTNHPLSPYAASKKAAETLCYSYHHLHSIDVTIFRYFTVYGPAGRPDMAPFRFVQWISEGRPVTVYGDGTQSRDFTYVDDIARGTIAGLRPVGYAVANLGSDRPVILMDVIHLIEDLVGQKAQLRFQPAHRADMSATWADISQAGKLLGWRPTWAFADGMASLVQWYNQNREWAKDVVTG